jgi:hypothetical protein
MCISHVIKIRDTCHFYILGLRRFLQPSLEENSVLLFFIILVFIYFLKYLFIFIKMTHGTFVAL